MRVFRPTAIAVHLLGGAGLFFVGAALAHAATFVIRGTVRDTSQNILPEVIVTAGPARVATNDKGEFAISLPERPAGYVDFEKPGYGERHVPLPANGEPMEVILKRTQNNAGLILESTRISMSHSLSTVRQLEPALLKRPLTEDVYREFVRRHGEAPAEEVLVRLYFPPDTRRVDGVFLISEHGIGGRMMEVPAYRRFAERHHFALVGVLGDAIQRGIYPAETLESLLTTLGRKHGHPELGSVPALTFGHSNGTGFSDLYAALRPERVIGWISYHCGASWQLKFPGLGGAPGLVVHGQKDALFTDQDEVVRQLRKERNAAVALLVEGKTAHWPVDRDKMDDMVIAFCEACLRIRPPTDVGAGKSLAPVRIEQGWLGAAYDRKLGGFQSPAIAPYAEYTGDRSTANWLPDESFARTWQHYTATGSVGPETP